MSMNNRDINQTDKLTKRDVQLVQKSLLDNHEDLFYFWTLSIYQAYYQSYYLNNSTAFQQRIQAFQTDLANTIPRLNRLLNENQKLLDKISSYATRFTTKHIKRRLMIWIECSNTFRNWNLSLKIIFKNEHGDNLASLVADSKENKRKKSSLYYLDLPIECNRMRNNQILIKMETDLADNLVWLINEGEVSGFEGYSKIVSLPTIMPNERKSINLMSISLKWNLCEKTLQRWLWNPSRFLPLLANSLLQMNRFYLYFYKPLYKCALISTYSNPTTTNNREHLSWSTLELLPKLQLINGENQDLASMFAAFCRHQSSSYESNTASGNGGETNHIDFEHVDLVLRNFHTFYCFLSQTQRKDVFHFLGKIYLNKLYTMQAALNKEQKRLLFNDFASRPKLLVILSKLIENELKKNDRCAKFANHHDKVDEYHRWLVSILDIVNCALFNGEKPFV